MGKEILSVIAIVLTIGLFFPYILSIHRGNTKPHVFTWVVWGLGTLVVAFAQAAGEAGPGAWPIGISGLITCYIAVLAYLKRADVTIARSDWVFFIAALSALPLWALTSDPLWAVVVLTLVDLSAFAPTVRKAYRNPWEENATFFALGALRNLIVLLALERYSLTTALFPAAVGIACLALVCLLLFRRRSVPQNPSARFQG